MKSSRGSELEDRAAASPASGTGDMEAVLGTGADSEAAAACEGRTQLERDGSPDREKLWNLLGGAAASIRSTSALHCSVASVASGGWAPAPAPELLLDRDSGAEAEAAVSVSESGAGGAGDTEEKEPESSATPEPGVRMDTEISEDEAGEAGAGVRLAGAGAGVTVVGGTVAASSTRHIMMWLSQSSSVPSSTE